jgi:putative membrane protein
MRWVHLTVIILLAAVTIVFAAQNFQTITVSLFGASTRAPLALLIAIAYLLGAATGGSLFALLRRSIAGAKRRPVTSS